jgi:hypothetical protein
MNWNNFRRPVHVANTARLLLQQSSVEVVIIVEGKDDETLLEKLVLQGKAVIQNAQNKWGALEAHKQARSDRVLCIVDCDFDRYLQRQFGGNGVLYYDWRDSENMLLRSESFKRLIRTEIPARHGVDEATVEALLTEAVEKSVSLSLLRCANEQHDYRLSFRDLDYDDYCANGRCSLDDAIRVVLAQNPHNNIGSARLKADAGKLSVQAGDHPWFCHGHDIFSIIASLVGRRWKRIGYGSQIESRVRVAYSARDFRASELYQALKAFEAKGGHRFLEA